MGFILRESDEIREITSLKGDIYRIQKSPLGFFEQITFYDEHNKEIENFRPTNDEADGVYEFEEEEIVLVEGMRIRTEFAFSEWFR